VNDPRVEARAIAGKIQQALSGLGFCEQPKDPGSLRPVLFRRIGLVGEPADPTYILIEVDTDHLPRKVRVDQLLSPRTLHHLSAVCGRRIAHLNAVGATYCVFMKPMPKVQLPRRVPLDLEDRPRGRLPDPHSGWAGMDLSGVLCLRQATSWLGVE